jgi:hypothetical protein
MTTNLRDINVYAITQDGRTKLRDVNVYAITSETTVLSVRQLSAFILTKPASGPPYGTAPLVGLLTAINNEQSRNFVASDLTFADPVVLDPATDYNTTVTVTATPTCAYGGSYLFNYARHPLSDAFADKVNGLPGVVGTTVYNTIAAINSKFGLALEQRDLVDGPIANGATSITLTIGSRSFYYLPGTTFVLTN